MQERQFRHQADTEPIAGYRLLAPLGRGGFGEVWKCQAPGGLLKAIKFVKSDLLAFDQCAADQELRAIQLVKDVRHPFLLSLERVEVVGDELVIVCELADRTLADVLADERQAGKSGIDRGTLLAYLREAAEALDVLHARHDLQHLDVKPHNLFLVSNHVKVGDFALVQSLSAGTRAGHASRVTATLRYAAPEVFEGRISPNSDQYSLAIVYQELLTGHVPFAGQNSRQLMMQHVQGEPDLEALSESDRTILRRALAKDPRARFLSCTDLVTALSLGQDQSRATVIELPLPPAPPEVDTRAMPSLKTVKVRTLPAVRPPAVGGLQYLGLVRRSPLGEVWNARTAAGEPRLVHVLFAGGVPTSNLERLAGLRHPALVPLEVLPGLPGKVVLSMPAGGRSLKDTAGLPGVPRSQVLELLRGIAEALDTLAGERGLFHLGLSPRTLIRDGGLRMTRFGVAQLIWYPTGQNLSSLNPRYSAPELAHRQLGSACDQYSLALLYHALITGSEAVAGSNGKPDLERLPASDRPAVARALSVEPGDRWPCCADLIRALIQAGIERPDPTPPPLWPGHFDPQPVPERGAGGLQMRFGTNLPADAVPQRFEGFARQWQARALTSDGRSFTYQMHTPRSFWQRWTGRQPALEIALAIGEPEIQAPRGVRVRTEIHLHIRPQDCSPERSKEMLESVGPLLVESLRQHLQAPLHGRKQERVTWPYPLRLFVTQPDGGLGPPIECQGKDISLNGIGFYIPGQLPSPHVRLSLPRTAQTPEMTVAARVVRVQGCGDGWYEVGAILMSPHELPAEGDA